MSARTISKVCLFAAACILLTTGCASRRVHETTRTPSRKNADQNAPEIALPKKVGGDLLHAFLNDDADKFLGMLPEAVAEEFGKNGFKQTRDAMLKDLGTPISYTYVCNLEHPTFDVSIWKILLERKSSDGTKTIRQEAMFRAVSGKLDGVERLLSFNFF